MSPDPSRGLRADAVYVAPSGRLCRWVPLGGAHNQLTAYSFFEYLPEPGRSRRRRAGIGVDGFVLTPPNYKLLREANHAPAR